MARCWGALQLRSWASHLMNLHITDTKRLNMGKGPLSDFLFLHIGTFYQLLSLEEFYIILYVLYRCLYSLHYFSRWFEWACLLVQEHNGFRQDMLFHVVKTKLNSTSIRRCLCFSCASLNELDQLTCTSDHCPLSRTLKVSYCPVAPSVMCAEW